MSSLLSNWIISTFKKKGYVKNAVMFSCFPYKKSRRIRSADGPWKEVSDWDREISRDSLAGCGCWNRWKPPRPGVSKWSPSQWGSLSRSKNAEMFADQQCCTNSWWFQGFLLFLTLKLEKNDPFCGGVESTMQRFPKDVKCRSTFETGSNLAKDFKDTFWFFFRSSQHVSTRQQKWILDDLGTSSWNFGSRICGKKPGEEIPDVLQERSQSPCPWIAVQWSLTSESNTNGMLDMWAARRGFKSRRSLNCKEGQGGTLAMKSRELGFLFGILGTTNSFDSKDRMNTLNLVDSLDSLHMNGYPKDR